MKYDDGTGGGGDGGGGDGGGDQRSYACRQYDAMHDHQHGEGGARLGVLVQAVFNVGGERHMVARKSLAAAAAAAVVASQRLWRVACAVGVSASRPSNTPKASVQSRAGNDMKKEERKARLLS